MKTGILKKSRIPLIILAAFIIVFFIYTRNFYHADEQAAEALSSDTSVAVLPTDYGWFFDGPSTENALIFYPGAKVEETAYAQLLHSLAEEGMDALLVKMPFRLAFFGMNKADRILEQYDYENVFIGGHSLGGAMAAVYASKHGDNLSGLILFAAYPTKQLDPDLTEITIYGSEDGVLNMKKIAEGRQYAPKNTIEHVIEGGNHAGFGNYGIQSGDGKAVITWKEQQEETVRIIIENALK